jgi:GT2 family glycosyltransferase
MPQYLADVDFCLRAKKKGYEILISSNSKLYNNVENTGGISFDNKKINWEIFKSIFISLRSPDYLRARLIFMIRHCKWYLLPFAIVIRYSRLLIYTMRRL